tara:strand:+ start:198 stop:695 length:498 start_codon:yes stop_codon:yes gene_type:complete
MDLPDNYKIEKGLTTAPFYPKWFSKYVVLHFAVFISLKLLVGYSGVENSIELLRNLAITYIVVVWGYFIYLNKSKANAIASDKAVLKEFFQQEVTSSMALIEKKKSPQKHLVKMQAVLKNIPEEDRYIFFKQALKPIIKTLDAAELEYLIVRYNESAKSNVQLIK